MLPAVLQGGDLKYTYAGREYVIKAGEAAANHQQCMATSTAAMNVTLACGLAVVSAADVNADSSAVSAAGHHQSLAGSCQQPVTC
jgi:hypothetical protein